MPKYTKDKVLAVVNKRTSHLTAKFEAEKARADKAEQALKEAELEAELEETQEVELPEVVDLYNELFPDESEE